MKILVVDDEASICQLCKLELEDEGYRVVYATNSRDAMTRFETEVPDLVTLDVKMSYDNEGIDLLRRMKKRRPRLPVIMLTAYDFRDEFGIWAADAYLTKSSDLTELKRKIKELTGGGAPRNYSLDNAQV